MATLRSILALVIVLLIAFAACGSESDDEDSRTITRYEKMLPATSSSLRGPCTRALRTVPPEEGILPPVPVPEPYIYVPLQRSADPATSISSMISSCGRSWSSWIRW